jgi:hypothetical protein
MGMKSKDLFVRIGAQSNRTTVASSFIDLAIPADGDQMNSDLAIESLDTDHGSRGILYSSKNAINGEQKQFQSYMFPVAMGTLMGNVLNRDSNGDQGFMSIEAWWGDAIGSGQVKGSRRLGVVMDSFSLTIDRTGQGQSLQVDFSGWINQRTNIATGESTPTPSFSTLLPWNSTGALIDFVYDNSVESYGMDNTDVRRTSISFANNGEVEAYTDSTSPELDRTWTIHTPGEESVEVEVTVALNDEKYTELDQNLTVAQGAMRVAFTHPSAASNAECTDTLTTGDNDTQTLSTDITDTDGFETGDVVIIQDTLGNFSVLPVETLVADTSFAFDTDTGGGTGYSSRVTLNGTTNGPLTIRNMAGGLMFDRLDFRGQSAPTRDGNKRVVTLRYEAALAVGAAAIVEGHFYDHLTSHA